MTKKMLWTEVDTFYPDSTVKHLIMTLQSYERTYGDNVRIEKCTRPYDDDYYYSVQHQVEETDEQYDKRLLQERQWAEQQEKRDKVELQRLLDKFGPGK